MSAWRGSHPCPVISSCVGSPGQLHAWMSPLGYEAGLEVQQKSGSDTLHGSASAILYVSILSCLHLLASKALLTDKGKDPHCRALQKAANTSLPPDLLSLLPSPSRHSSSHPECQQGTQALLLPLQLMVNGPMHTKHCCSLPHNLSFLILRHKTIATWTPQQGPAHQLSKGTLIPWNQCWKQIYWSIFLPFLEMFEIMPISNKLQKGEVSRMGFPVPEHLWILLSALPTWASTHLGLD